MGAGADGFALAGDRLGVGIDLAAAVTFGSTIHEDCAVFEEFFDLRTGVWGAFGEQLVESGLRHKIPFYLT